MDKIKKIIDTLKNHRKKVMAILVALASIATITTTEIDDKIVAKLITVAENALTAE